jgi:dTDP-4-dehydrorhamnose 3,5-epimerase
MEVLPTDIPEVRIIVPARHGDERGFFSEIWSRRAFAAAGIDVAFVQDNHSLSAEPWTLRGLHFQTPPLAQTKLVRVARGAILDVVVDLRASSPTYGRHVAVELSAANWRQLLVPKGFAHGLLTLEPMTEVLYKVDEEYAPAHDRGVRWDDPDLAIPWPLEGRTPILSARDRAQPAFRDLPAWFP